MRNIDDLQTEKYKAEAGIVFSHLLIFGGLIFILPGVIAHWTFFIVAAFLFLAGLALRQASKNSVVHVSKSLLYKVFKPSIEQEFQSLKVSPSQGIDPLFFQNNKLIQTGNYYRSSQCIEGKLADTMFKAAYVVSEHVKQGNIKRYSTTTYFDGKVLDFEFDQRFSHAFTLRKEYTRSETEKRKDYTPLSLNRNYIVDLIDQEVAEKLITDAFIEAFSLYKRSIKTPVTIHFYQHHCTIMIEDDLPFVDTQGGKSLTSDTLEDMRVLLNSTEQFIQAILKETTLWQ